MRGKHIHASKTRIIERITPARAGKTSRGIPRAGPYADHPRACGENYKYTPESTVATGSPPRVRGKLGHSESMDTEGRITPARAGKTYSTPPSTSKSKDHPRACGENMWCSTRTRLERGSPPRVRGKHTRMSCKRASVRITPARAGKTSARQGAVRPYWDHPRACGENPSRTSRKACSWGSPPRVRGKH